MRKTIVVSMLGLIGLAGAGPLAAQQWQAAGQPSYLSAPRPYTPAAEYRLAARTPEVETIEAEAPEPPVMHESASPYSSSSSDGAYLSDSCSSHGACDSCGGYGCGGGPIANWLNSCGYNSCDGAFWLSADWMLWKRDNGFTNGRNVINGPDAFRVGDLDFNYESGYRIRGGFAFENWIVEGSYWHINQWLTENAGDLTAGVAFDTGLGPGEAFEGQNYVDNSTFFSPIHRAATITAETDEFEGLGPNGEFPADDAPVFTQEYWFGVKMFDLFAKSRCWSRGCTGYRFGVGYANIQWDELNRATVQGTFRAADVGGAPNGGLVHASLVDPAAAGLTHVSGAANGFDDETGAGGADTLALFHQANTRNSLNGVQFLYETRLVRRCHFLLDAYMKAGVYDNRATGTIEEFYNEITADNSIYSRHLTDSRHQIAYSGSFGFNSAIPINDYVALRIGYEVMFIDGLALSPEQLDGVVGNQYRVNTHGSALLHGGWLGGEFTY